MDIELTREELEALEDEREAEHDAFRIPRSAESVGQQELPKALNGLVFLGESHAMRMQVTSIGIVDTFIMEVETTVRNRLFQEERTPIDDAAFLQAQTQMWIFATYELLRTWRQRLNDIIKWQRNGGLQAKIEVLRKDTNFLHYDRQGLAHQLERVVADPSIVDLFHRDLLKTAIPFHRLEFVRVALAKHEISGKAKALAYNPGYARIDQFTGSLQYELSNERYVTGTITRREIADEIRAFPEITELPTEADIKDFLRFL